MNLKNIILSFLILFGTWILLDSNLEWQHLIAGGVVALLISLIFCYKCDVFSELKLTPMSFVNTIVYLLVFFVELIKSNLDVAYRVISPSLPINPGIVKVRTKLKSRMGRLILANSITLTPGTFTVDIKDENLYIHWIDVKDKDINAATEKIVRKFEKYLEGIYG